MIQALQIQTNEGSCDAWMARPSGNGQWPGVIFCMDAVGPRPVLKQMAERLAESGYVVLLTNLFYRVKAAPIVEDIEFPAKIEDLPKILDQIMPHVEKFDVQKAVEDVSTFIKFLVSQRHVHAGKLGIFGYCMGGALAIRAAAAYPEKFGAVASFHAGGLVGDGDESPHRLLPKLRASLYVGHADQDPHMAPEQIGIFNQEASKMSAPHKIELYSGAHHHFTMSDLPAYNAEASEKHWQRLLELFKANL